MIEFEKPNYKITDYVESNFYGKFEIEPLERGFGTTLGNALRRVMLSSLPGSAISSVKIEGALHEFQTVEGVVEDVTTIILNLKKVVVKKPVSTGSVNTSLQISHQKVPLSINLIRPISGTITSRFGRRSGGTHTGLDIANSTGTPIASPTTNPKTEL